MTSITNITSTARIQRLAMTSQCHDPTDNTLVVGAVLADPHRQEHANQHPAAQPVLVVHTLTGPLGSNGPLTSKVQRVASD